MYVTQFDHARLNPLSLVIWITRVLATSGVKLYAKHSAGASVVVTPLRNLVWLLQVLSFKVFLCNFSVSRAFSRALRVWEKSLTLMRSATSSQ